MAVVTRGAVVLVLFDLVLFILGRKRIQKQVDVANEAAFEMLFLAVLVRHGITLSFSILVCAARSGWEADDERQLVAVGPPASLHCIFFFERQRLRPC